MIVTDQITSWVVAAAWWVVLSLAAGLLIGAVIRRRKRQVPRDRGLESSRERPVEDLAPARVAINLSNAVVATIVEMCAREAITMTEATRRLVDYGHAVHSAAQQGRTVVARGPGPDDQVVLLDPPEGGTPR